MEGEAIEESIVCGHHIYKEVWRPVIGQEFPVLSEPNHNHDMQTSGSNLYGEGNGKCKFNEKHFTVLFTFLVQF